MLQRASVSDIKAGALTKSEGHLVVTMRAYPRFLSRSLVHDYKPSLSPQKELFGRYRDIKKKIGDQNQAFERAGYQREFKLGPDGLQDLRDLAELSKQENVYLICQCKTTERCHVDLMLLIAKTKWGAEIGDLPFEYSDFLARL